MTESSAEAKYREFETLRKCFGSEQGRRAEPEKECCKPQHFRIRECGAGKRRHDPRANAPPLVPLVEEGDQLDEVVDNRALIKGKWKHSCILKSNHLNSPDFDALETASASSAYSSRSESSILSPPCGSMTELSDDTGSCDTFQEYDTPSHRSHQPRPQHFPPALRTPKRTAGEGSPAVTPSEFDVSPNFVKDHTHSWNKAIGEWKFEGISPILSPSAPHTLRVSNEMRLPTPVWTPQGSTDNLLETESRCSLLSSGEESSSIGGWVPERHARLGKFVRRSCSTSNLVGAFQSLNFSEINHMRSFSGTDLLVTGTDNWGASFGKEGGEQSTRAGQETAPKCDELTGLKMVSENLRTGSCSPNSPITRPSTWVEPPCEVKTQPSTWVEPVKTQPSTWVEPPCEAKSSGSSSSKDQRAGPEVKSVVKQRALLFGGMK